MPMTATHNDAATAFRLTGPVSPASTALPRNAADRRSALPVLTIDVVDGASASPERQTSRAGPRYGHEESGIRKEESEVLG